MDDREHDEGKAKRARQPINDARKSEEGDIESDEKISEKGPEITAPTDMVLAHVIGSEVVAHVVIDLSEEHDALRFLEILFPLEGDSRSDAHHRSDDHEEKDDEKRAHQRSVNRSPAIPMEHRFHFVLEGMGGRACDSIGNG